ncbi:DUF4282 domain-containing protein [Streptomyces bicolor]|uniref:DUF4282 domain-containing protein n=1 Tax=Streptomyces bicolor TaxID=66874 RepID=UPI0034DCC8B3
MRFRRLTTPQIIQFTYTLFLTLNAVLSCALIVAGVVVAAIWDQYILIPAAIIACPLYCIFSTFLFRVVMERILVLFRIYEEYQRASGQAQQNAHVGVSPDICRNTGKVVPLRPGKPKKPS